MNWLIINNGGMKMADIKKTITDLFSFDIENDYYQEDEKQALVDAFKEMLFDDNETVRKFLQAFMTSSLELAKEYELVTDGEEDVEAEEGEEETTDDEEATEDDTEDDGETEFSFGADDESEEESTEESTEEDAEEETTEESVQVTEAQLYIKRANRWLI